MKKYKVYNIKWDCDGDKKILATLPNEMEVKVDDNLTNSDEIMDFISDKISDETGYCHFGFDFYKEDSVLTREELIKAISKLEREDILFVYAHSKDGEQFTMGAEKHQVLDGVIVFLCNVMGSNCDFEPIPLDDSDIPDEEVFGKVADYFFNTAKANYEKELSHLSLG